MAIRLFYYITEIWRKYLKRFKSDEVKKKDFKLPAIIPIVLYNGDKTWTATTQFKDKVQRADLFGNHVIDFNYLLINVHDYTKETLLGIQNTVSAIFLLDQKIDAVEFINRAALIATEFDSLSKEHKLKLKDWLDHVIKDPVRQIVLHLLNANKEEVSTMTANITRTLQEDQEKAEARGKARGEARGEEKAKLEVAKKMLARGISLEDVIDMTGLPKETLLDLH